MNSEQVVIAMMLKWSDQVAPAILPDLTPDLFNEYTYVWKQIVDLQSEGKRPVVALIEGIDFDLDLEPENIYEFNINVLMKHAEYVYKTGVLRSVVQEAKKLSKLEIEKLAPTINLDSFMSDVVDKFNYTKDKTGYKHISEVGDRLLEKWDLLYNGQQVVILPVGIPIFLSSQLFPRGQLAILHGMSGTGKSALLMTILLGTAIGLKAEGIDGCVALNSLEMDDEQLVARCASLLAGIDHTRLIGGKQALDETEYEKLKDWTKFVQTLPIYIDDSNLMDTGVMKYQANSLHIQKGPIIQLGSDYSELFNDSIENKEQRIEQVSRNHFAIARMLDCSVLMISQSTYETTAKDRIAGMNGLRWSRGATMAANIILELVNYPAMLRNGVKYVAPDDMGDTFAWVLIEKYRGGETGKFPLDWEGSYTRFVDPEHTRANRGKLEVFEHLKRIPEAERLLKKYDS